MLKTMRHHSYDWDRSPLEFVPSPPGIVFGTAVHVYSIYRHEFWVIIAQIMILTCLVYTDQPSNYWPGEHDMCIKLGHVNAVPVAV